VNEVDAERHRATLQYCLRDEERTGGARTGLEEEDDLFVFNDIWKGEDGIVPEYLKDPHGVDRGARGGEGGGKSS